MIERQLANKDPNKVRATDDYPEHKRMMQHWADTKRESTVRYLGIELDDALDISEQNVPDLNTRDKQTIRCARFGLARRFTM